MTHIQEKKQLQQMAETLAKQNRFKKSEIELLQNYYLQTFGKGKLNRSQFREFVLSLGINDDLMMDRVFKVFDANNDSHVDMEEWIKGVSTWLRGSDVDKFHFAFKVYDMNGDGVIGRDDMFGILKKAEIKPQADEDPEEGIKDLVEMVQRRLAGQLRSGTQNTALNVTSEDFDSACEADSLHVELLGQCFPTRAYVEEFEVDVFHPKVQEKKWYF